MGKAKGVQFLVWDVGGQEKLRPLWRSYTRLVQTLKFLDLFYLLTMSKYLSITFFRCTDGIVFVVDSVDVERMEEAKMELMRTAKCSENHVSHQSLDCHSL